MIQADAILRAICTAKSLRYVGTRGDTSAPAVVIGRDPGAEEDQAGKPFIGASGREQDRMLADAGWNPANLWFTNVIKVRIPGNDIKRFGELGIPIELFHNQTLEELQEHKPTIIIPAGETALAFLCPQCTTKKGNKKNTNITKWQGSLLTSPKLQWTHYVVPVIHPAFVLREWSERAIAVLCYGKALDELDYWRSHGMLQPLPARQLLVDLSSDEIIQFLRECLEWKDPLSIDIEMLQKRFVYTVGIARSPDLAISFSLWNFPTDKLMVVFRLLDELLRTHRQIGQNYLNFDSCWFNSLGFTVNSSLVQDTMIRHHVLWPEFPHSLAFQTVQYTREPFYKDDGRRWTPKDDMSRLRRYNARDSAVTYEVFNAQEEEFANG